MTPNAVKRLKAIEEFTELGAGFKIALRDLEIRGAGNILGAEQSGHIESVGYELYCSLLGIRFVRSPTSELLRWRQVRLLDRAFLASVLAQGLRARAEGVGRAYLRRLGRTRSLERLGAISARSWSTVSA